MNPIERRPQPTASQRVANALQAVNSPITCKKCGGIFFMEIKAQMYTAGSYGLRGVSTMAMTVYQCPCGEIALPPNQTSPAGSERDLFARSLAASIKFKASNSLDAASENVAGIHELKELQDEVDRLTDRIDELTGVPLASLPTVIEDDLGEQELTEDDQEDMDAAAAQLDEPVRSIFAGPREVREELQNTPPIANSRRGRSMASAQPGSGEGNVKVVNNEARKIPEGGARAQMRRQGRGGV